MSSNNVNNTKSARSFGQKILDGTHEVEIEMKIIGMNDQLFVSAKNSSYKTSCFSYCLQKTKQEHSELVVAKCADSELSDCKESMTIYIAP